MKNYMRNTLGVAAICGAVVLAGCAPQTSSNPSGTPGPAEKAGAALDRAADKTVETTTNAAAKAVDKTGEVIEKAGAAVEKVGADMQK
jgi:hypothetical protein